MMDFNLKQWRNESEAQQETSEKLPTLLLNSSSSAPLPLFSTTTTNSSSDNMSTTSARMGSYFSVAQWQELELQALIFRHMIAGAAIPPELLHLVKKSIITSSSPYYICNPLHQYYPHYQPTLLQSGYWGRAAMDPEPGRCRRTDGKKWRCSRDVVAGQKYCERHMHRGRNRSRKPVEIPTSTTAAAATAAYGGGGGGGGPLRTNHATAQGMGTAGGGGGTAHFSLSGPSPSMDLLHLNRRPSESINETECPFESQNDGQTGAGQTLRHFFDDWPRSLHDPDNNANSATNLSISMPSSDVSLKLGTGNGDESRAQGTSGGRESRPQINWGSTWENNRVGPMGGPLAEALRSSTSTSSPTSVLQRIARSEASYVSS